MRALFTTIVYLSWLIIVAIWSIGFFTSKSAARTPKLELQLPVSGLLLLSFLLLFAPGLFGLKKLVTPHSAVLSALGSAAAVAGAMFAVWARLALGRNWSGIVATAKKGHELIRTGPYAIVRHPIYAGFIFAMFGTALTLGNLGSYLGFAAGLVAFMIRIRIEEAIMLQQFGEDYRAYCAQTRRLIPLLW